MYDVLYSRRYSQPDNRKGKMSKKKPEGWNLTDALKKEKRVYKATGSRRMATRAYCSGHKWLEENAKDVGNW